MKRSAILLSLIFSIMVFSASVYGFDASLLLLTQTDAESSISDDHLTMKASETKRLILYGTGIAKVTTDDERVAIVSKDGTVTAVAPGRAKIVLEGENGKKHKCIVTVVPNDDLEFDRKYGEELYQSILQPYYQAYLNGWSTEEYVANGLDVSYPIVNEVFDENGNHVDDGKPHIGYIFHDLNNDGVPEMLLSSSGYHDLANTYQRDLIYAIYTIVDDRPFLVIDAAGYRDSYTLMEGGYLRLTWSASSESSGDEIYRLSDEMNYENDIQNLTLISDSTEKSVSDNKVLIDAYEDNGNFIYQFVAISPHYYSIEGFDITLSGNIQNSFIDADAEENEEENEDNTDDISADEWYEAVLKERESQEQIEESEPTEIYDLKDYSGVGKGSVERLTELANLLGLEKSEDPLYPDAYFEGNGVIIGLNINASTETPCEYTENNGNKELSMYGVQIGMTEDEAVKAGQKLSSRAEMRDDYLYLGGESKGLKLSFDDNGRICTIIDAMYYTG